jgi:hypothetical protein
VNARATILTLAVGFAGAALAHAEDPNMGTWKLNEAKSNFSAGAPKNSMVTYEPAGDSTKIVVVGVDGEGKAIHSEWTGKFDGKDYAVTGDSTSDMRAYTKVDDHTLNFTVKNKGAVTATGKVVVSADGKSRTVTVTGTDPKGNKTRTRSVYDKQ